MNAEDQVWLGRWARQWAVDEKNKFCNPAKPNEMDRQLLALFDAIETCQNDIDERLKELHRTLRNSGFLTQALYQVKLDYLFRGVGYEVAMRAGEKRTASARQTLLNWNRVQDIYNGQDGSFTAAKAWIGPSTPSGHGQGISAEVEKRGWRALGGGRYLTGSGVMVDGLLVDLAMGIGKAFYGWRDRKTAESLEEASSAAIAKAGEERMSASWDDGVVTDA